MKELVIRKKRNKSVRAFFILTVLAGLFLLSYLTDDQYSQDSSGRTSSYVTAISIWSIFLLSSIYIYFNQSVLYVINEKGIRFGKRATVSWQDISSFKLDVYNANNITWKQATLYDHYGKEIAILDVSFADVSVDQLGFALKEKIRQVGQQ